MAAGDTTTVSLAHTINQKWISPRFQSKARHYQNPSQFACGWDPTIGTSTVSVPRFSHNEGTPNDGGSAVDSEFDADEATSLVPKELTDEESHFSIREYGMARRLSYTLVEDTIAGDLFGQVQQDEAMTLMTAFNDDVTANFADFSESSGSPNTAMSLLDLDDALFDLAERGVQGTLVGVLSHQQCRDWDASILDTDAATSVYAGATDRILRAAAENQQGRNADGLAFTYRGVNFYRSGLTDTANTGQDDVGAIFVQGDEPNRAMSAIGKAKRRDFMLEMDRVILDRVVVIVGTMRQGTGVTQPDHGQAIITKAATT